MASDDKLCIQDEDEWAVECSDEEKYKIIPENMREEFEKLASGQKLNLEWKFEHRRSPTPERQEVQIEATTEEEKEPVQPQRIVPAAFDFDPSSEGNRSTAGPQRLKVSTKTPRSNQKRVARLDKIMNDMIRHKRIDDEAAMSEQLNQVQQASPMT